MAFIAANSTLWSMLWSATICGHASVKYCTPFLQSDWPHKHCGVLHKSMYYRLNLTLPRGGVTRHLTTTTLGHSLIALTYSSMFDED